MLNYYKLISWNSLGDTVYNYDTISNSDGIFCNLTEVLTKYIPNTCLKQCCYYKLLGVLKVESRRKIEGPVLLFPENNEQMALIAQTLAKRVTSGPSCGIKIRNFLKNMRSCYAEYRGIIFLRNVRTNLFAYTVHKPRRLLIKSILFTCEQSIQYRYHFGFR